MKSKKELEKIKWLNGLVTLSGLARALKISYNTAKSRNYPVAYTDGHKKKYDVIAIIEQGEDKAEKENSSKKTEDS